jgi:hypothetical protein
MSIFFYEWRNRTWEGFPLFVINYGVGISEAYKIRNGGGGLGFETHPNEKIIDRKVNENYLEIFEIETLAQQKQFFVQLKLNQKLWITWQRSVNTWAFFKFTLLQKYDFFHTNIMIMLIIKPRSK